MKMEVEQSSEEIKTWLFLFYVAVSDSFVHESFRLENFVVFNLLVNWVAGEGEAVTAYDWDYLKTIWVFVLGEFLPCLREVFACHEIVFVVHS